MKYFSVLFALVLILSACSPAPAPTSTPTLTPTLQKVSTPTETPIIPTATGTGLFDITADTTVIQKGNDAPAFKLHTVPSWELADNHIGVWWEDYGRYQ